jgi:hypothetical protein
LLVAPYAVPPHPANEAFAKCMEGVMMKTIGLHLNGITTEHSSILLGVRPKITGLL